MSKLNYVVARGCFRLGDEEYKQGELIELTEDDAKRWLALGILCVVEEAPGYKSVPGKKWLRLKGTINSVNEGESGVAGDICHYNENEAMNMIDYGLAELYEVPKHV